MITVNMHHPVMGDAHTLSTGDITTHAIPLWSSGSNSVTLMVNDVELDTLTERLIEFRAARRASLMGQVA